MRQVPRLPRVGGEVVQHDAPVAPHRQPEISDAHGPEGGRQRAPVESRVQSLELVQQRLVGPRVLRDDRPVRRRGLPQQRATTRRKLVILDTCQVEHGREDVREHDRVDTLPGRHAARRADHERDGEQRLEHAELVVDQSVIAQVLAVVGRNDNDGVLRKPVLLQGFHEAPEQRVGGVHVARVQVAHAVPIDSARPVQSRVELVSPPGRHHVVRREPRGV